MVLCWKRGWIMLDSMFGVFVHGEYAVFRHWILGVPRVFGETRLGWENWLGWGAKEPGGWKFSRAYSNLSHKQPPSKTFGDVSAQSTHNWVDQLVKGIQAMNSKKWGFWHDIGQISSANMRIPIANRVDTWGNPQVKGIVFLNVDQGLRPPSHDIIKPLR